jgi:hypothetical protein
MPVRVELGIKTITVTATTAALEIIPSATVPLRIVELMVTDNSGTATNLGLGPPAAAGVTPTNNLMQLADPTISYTVVSNVAVAWVSPPTAPASFYRLMAATQVGGGVLWVWPYADALVIPAGKTLVLWNVVTGSVVQVQISGYEG